MAANHGKGVGLSKDIKKWLDERMPDYMKLTGIGNAEYWKPIPDDDKKLPKWVKETLDAFETDKDWKSTIENGQKGDENYLPKLRKQMTEYFRNHKTRAIDTLLKKTALDVVYTATPKIPNPVNTPATSAPPILSPVSTMPVGRLLEPAPKVSGRQLFYESIHNEVNTAVNLERKGMKDRERQEGEKKKHNGQEHVGMLQRERRRRWDALNFDSQEEWNRTADKANEGDKRAFFGNQNRVIMALAETLQSVQGYEADQAGHFTFSVLYAYRDEEGNTRTGRLTVCDNNDRFDFGVNTQETWRSFAEAHLADYPGHLSGTGSLTSTNVPTPAENVSQSDNDDEASLALLTSNELPPNRSNSNTVAVASDSNDHDFPPTSNELTPNASNSKTVAVDDLQPDNNVMASPTPLISKDVNPIASNDGKVPSTSDEADPCPLNEIHEPEDSPSDIYCPSSSSDDNVKEPMETFSRESTLTPPPPSPVNLKGKGGRKRSAGALEEPRSKRVKTKTISGTTTGPRRSTRATEQASGPQPRTVHEPGTTPKRNPIWKVCNNEEFEELESAVQKQYSI